MRPRGSARSRARVTRQQRFRSPTRELAARTQTRERRRESVQDRSRASEARAGNALDARQAASLRTAARWPAPHAVTQGLGIPTDMVRLRRVGARASQSCERASDPSLGAGQLQSRGTSAQARVLSHLQTQARTIRVSSALGGADQGESRRLTQAPLELRYDANAEVIFGCRCSRARPSGPHGPATRWLLRPFCDAFDPYRPPSSMEPSLVSTKCDCAPAAPRRRLGTARAASPSAPWPAACLAKPRLLASTNLNCRRLASVCCLAAAFGWGGGRKPSAVQRAAGPLPGARTPAPAHTHSDPGRPVAGTSHFTAATQQVLMTGTRALYRGRSARCRRQRSRAWRPTLRARCLTRSLSLTCAFRARARAPPQLPFWPAQASGLLR